MHCFIVFPFFLNYSTNAECMISGWPVALKSTLISPVISSAYGVSLDSRILDKILYVVDMPVCFITLLMDRYSDWLLPHLRQFLFILNRIGKFMDLRMNCPTPCFNQLCWDLCLFSSSIAISTSEAQGLSTWGSAACIFFCLTSPTPCTFSSWEKWFLHLAKIQWNSVTLLFSSFTILVLGW